MKSARFEARTLAKLLHNKKIATMDELKEALGSKVTMTVFRKLKQLGYRSSFSHGGGYYTLQEIPRYDEHGLWYCGPVGFSRHGTLLATCEALVEQAEAGLLAGELKSLLGVEVKGALLQLVRRGRISRRKVAGRYLYCHARSALRARQLLQRQSSRQQPGRRLPDLQSTSGKLRRALALFVSLLNEKQRRLFAGLEALRWGRGGVGGVARLLGMDPATVARGRRELLEGKVDPERVRAPGAGRKAVEKKRPDSSRPSGGS